MADDDRVMATSRLCIAAIMDILPKDMGFLILVSDGNHTAAGGTIPPEVAVDYLEGLREDDGEGFDD